MTYLVVRSAAALVDEGFFADAVLLKGTFHEVDELITDFIVTCYDESAMFAIKCMTYGEGFGTTVTF